MELSKYKGQLTIESYLKKKISDLEKLEKNQSKLSMTNLRYFRFSIKLAV